MIIYALYLNYIYIMNKWYKYYMHITYTLNILI